MKKLILCCDGTWNRADQQRNGIPCPTNVVKLAYRVAKHDGGTPQLIYYDHGVGTGNLFDRIVGGAFGEGLEDNIHDAYRFLIANYEPGDEIYLFGFSRGAFTARSIGGMLRKCGVLKRTSVREYRTAIDLYRNGAVRPDDPIAKKFRWEHSIGEGEDVRVKCIGVFDTVGALGIPVFLNNRRRHSFHDTELSRTVDYAFHALAIDERRAPFRAALWDYIPKPGQIVRQVWFSGAHSDVGGGYETPALSDISLEWMMGCAEEAGLVFDPAVVAANPLNPDPLSPVHNSRRGFYLVTPPASRPIGIYEVQEKDRLHSTYTARGGAGAIIADPTQSLHPSVLTRWQADERYRPSNLEEFFKRSERLSVGRLVE
jgi:uncharacterized protein (DUF2235 family)